MKVLGYLLFFGALVGIVREWPMLWELGVAGAIGGAWWIFFRESGKRA